MSKYEIMLVLSGKLDEETAKKTTKEIVTTLGDVKDFKQTDHGLKTLAYEINGNDKGYYVQFNFEGNGANIDEFKRLAVINPAVLRNLVVNLEKDYAFKATSNDKKIKKVEKKKVKKVEFDKRRAEEIANNPELAAKYAQRERRFKRDYHKRDE